MIRKAWLVFLMAGFLFSCGQNPQYVPKTSSDESTGTDAASAVIKVQQNPSYSSPAPALFQASEKATPLTRYQLLAALNGLLVSDNLMFTSVTTSVVYSGSGSINQGASTITLPNIKLGPYLLKVDGLTAGGSTIFTKTLTTTIVKGTNSINVALDVAPSFPTTFTIINFQSGASGNYPVTVSQVLSNNTVTTSIVTGTYDSSTGILVFTPLVALWPNSAIMLTYNIANFGTTLFPDPLDIDVVALLQFNHSVTAEYQALYQINFGVVTPTLSNMGLDLATSAGFVGQNTGTGLGTRVAGTGNVTITRSGLATDVMLTVPFNAIVGQWTPFSFMCTGNTATFFIGAAQSFSPYSDIITQMTQTCGSSAEQTIFIVPPIKTDPNAKLQLRLGAAPAGTIFNYSNLSF